MAGAVHAPCRILAEVGTEDAVEVRGILLECKGTVEELLGDYVPRHGGSDAKASPAALAREAMGIYEKAVNLKRQGNWAGYGEELRRLEQVHGQMAK